MPSLYKEPIARHVRVEAAGGGAPYILSVSAAPYREGPYTERGPLLRRGQSLRLCVGLTPALSSVLIFRCRTRSSAAGQFGSRQAQDPLNREMPGFQAQKGQVPPMTESCCTYGGFGRRGHREQGPGEIVSLYFGFSETDKAGSERLIAPRSERWHGAALE